MGKRGRPRKSVGQHVVEGTYRPERHDGQGIDSPGSPTMPDHLNADGRWLWETVVSNLPQGVLGAIDTAALRTGCEIYELYCYHYRHGETTKAVSAAKQVDSFLGRYGWTPSDRAKLPTPKVQQDDDSKFFGVVG